jgi:hypothetical protein
LTGCSNCNRHSIHGSTGLLTINIFGTVLKTKFGGVGRGSHTLLARRLGSSIEVLVGRPYTQYDLKRGVASLRKNIAEGDYPYSIDDDVEKFRAELAAIEDRTVWASGVMVWEGFTPRRHA